jgi:hypothetical protein
VPPLQERPPHLPGERAGVVVTDLWVLAGATFFCALLVAAFGIAERQRFTDPRPAPRHRRPMSRSELVMEVREVLYTCGYVALGLYALGAGLLAPLVRLFHLRDRWRERRLWRVKDEPLRMVVEPKRDAPVEVAAPRHRKPMVLTIDLGYLGTRTVVLPS